jgi:hypothetical protein
VPAPRSSFECLLSTSSRTQTSSVRDPRCLSPNDLLFILIDLGATTDIALWSNIEIGLGIFAGSMAALRPLLRLIHNKGRQYLGYQYPNTSRLRSDDKSKSFKRMPSEQSGNLAKKFGSQNNGITLTTVHSTGVYASGGGSGNGSDDDLNPLPGIQDLHREYRVQKTFEVTTTKGGTVENL